MTLLEQTKQKIEVMQSFVDGKVIQYHLRGEEGHWWDIKEPCWAWDASDYRVKPEAELTHNFKTGDEVILKYSCKGGALTQNDICKVKDVDNDSLQLDISDFPYCPNDFVKVDDVLWYWEYQHKNGLWCITSCRLTKEGIIKHLSEYRAINLIPLYALGARLPENEAKDD
ncbi:hypothetical protein [Campylobacter curvus]|nr:hypothetical protein [Campylobacter curvus]